MSKVIIIGGGRVGIYLIEKLKKLSNYDITVIDSHKDIIKFIEKKFKDVTVILGNATNNKVLEKAKIGEADILVIATSNDEVNLLIGITAQKYNLNKIIARTTEPEHIKIFNKLGLNEVVSPELAACLDIEKLIVTDENLSDVTISSKGDFELIDLPVKSKKIIGKSIGQISPSKNFIVVMCRKDDETLIASDDIVLEKEDVVTVLVKNSAIKKTKKFFTKTVLLPL